MQAFHNVRCEYLGKSNVGDLPFTNSSTAKMRPLSNKSEASNPDEKHLENSMVLATVEGQEATEHRTRPTADELVQFFRSRFCVCVGVGVGMCV